MSQRSENEETAQKQGVYETIIQHGTKTSIHIARIRTNLYKNDVDTYHKDKNNFINQFRQNIDQEGNNKKLRNLVVSCSNDNIHRQFYCDEGLFCNAVDGDIIKTRLGKWYRDHKNFDVISEIDENINTELSDLFDKFLEYKGKHHKF